MRNRKTPSEPVYIMMNKAAGTVCSTVSDRRKTVYQAFPQELLVSKEGAKLHTVGRLDADTTGLLFLTNDGKFSNYLTRPENKIRKIYQVTLKEEVSLEDQKLYSQKAAAGIELPAEKKSPVQQSGSASIEWPYLGDDQKTTKVCQITLTEGKFHEVKRIFRALGNEVVALKRLSVGRIMLDADLKEGQWRLLSEKEVEILQK